jgi:2,3-dihydroxybenzoate decarboxylase
VHIEIDPKIAIKKASASNDFLAAQIQRNPERYRGFAHLSMHEPQAAIAELNRCVKELGFLGALINGHTLGIYLDDPKYQEFWQCVSELDIPIYLHPVNSYGMPYMLRRNVAVRAMAS